MSKDGGSAFPWNQPPFQPNPGMSLRDYFAIHCDQPGEAEIAVAAGFIYSKGQIWESADRSLGYFAEWYSKLSNQERFALYSKVRYAMADAMLLQRDAAPSEQEKK